MTKRITFGSNEGFTRFDYFGCWLCFVHITLRTVAQDTKKSNQESEAQQWNPETILHGYHGLQNIPNSKRLWKGQESAIKQR